MWLGYWYTILIDSVVGLLLDVVGLLLDVVGLLVSDSSTLVPGPNQSTSQIQIL